MKKSIFIIAGAALLLSSCAQDALRNDFNNGEDLQKSISFETFAQKASRAENSSATNTYGLEKHHQTFVVWGNKYVNSVSTAVFGTNNGAGVTVNYSSGDGWYYSPLRFWDKAADKYDFFAAAPANAGWSFNNKIFTLSSFSVDGASLAVSTTCSSDAKMPNGKDIMIATDWKREGMLTSKNYDEVDLEFNHILSRLNIAVKKASILAAYTLKLDKVKVYKMKKTGAFNEASASGNALASGSVARWTSNTEYSFGYEASGNARTAIASGDTYVYQGLIIPQKVEWESIKLDGSSTETKPYIVIGYTMYDASGDAVPGGAYEYYYNLADIFNGTGTASGDVELCEGYMNTLKITIKPDAIEFCPEVFEWAEKTVSVNVPDINASGDAN